MEQRTFQYFIDDNIHEGLGAKFKILMNIVKRPKLSEAKDSQKPSQLQMMQLKAKMAKLKTSNNGLWHEIDKSRPIRDDEHTQHH